MRVGIMGGTLDPIHNGHIASARFVRDHLHLDSVMLLPAGDPPHKLHPTDKYDRFAMAQLATENESAMFASDMEITRERTTYTVDTLTELHATQPDIEWFYIIGADTLDVLDTWREFDRVARLCTFAVIGRGEEAASRENMDRLSHVYGARFAPVPFMGPDISSTHIRECVAHGDPFAQWVPGNVADYIREKGIYLCGMSFEAVRTELQKSLKPSRYTHTLGVADTAKRLAPRFGVDPMRAYLAGLLHDCAKYLPLDEMCQLVKGRITDLDDDELSSVSLMHAPAGAVMAEDRFGVKDPLILSAIRKHTLGDGSMSAMDALIYTADFIEPNRADFPGLSAVRETAEFDIFAAMRMCTELTRQYVQKQGKKLHPRMFEILNNYSGGSEK